MTKHGEPSIWAAAAGGAWGEEGAERRGIGILRVDRGEREIILESRSLARAPGLRYRWSRSSTLDGEALALGLRSLRFMAEGERQTDRARGFFLAREGRGG